jgi:hypothetical protein
MQFLVDARRKRQEQVQVFGPLQQNEKQLSDAQQIELFNQAWNIARRPDLRRGTGLGA